MDLVVIVEEVEVEEGIVEEVIVVALVVTRFDFCVVMASQIQYYPTKRSLKD